MAEKDARDSIIRIPFDNEMKREKPAEIRRLSFIVSGQGTPATAAVIR